MNIIDLNQNWKLSVSDRAAPGVIPEGAEEVSLPFDLLPSRPRNTEVRYGSFNSYYDTEGGTLYRYLPQLKKAGHVILELDGVACRGDVYLNDILVDTVTTPTRTLIDLTDEIDFSGKNLLKVAFTSMPGTARYVGAGITRGARLLVVEDDLYIAPHGVFVSSTFEGTKAAVRLRVEAVNESDQPRQFTLQADVLNARGKRVAKKLRRVKLAAGAEKTFDIPVRMTRHYDWSASDPYLYTMKVSLVSGESVLDCEAVPFGICPVELKNKSLSIGGAPTKLKGAVVAHDNGILGGVSTETAELRKLSAVKEAGFNAVRYIGCPSEAALTCLDKLGLLCLVDLFDVWSQGDLPFDGHLTFSRDAEAVIYNSVRQLRNHPSVVMYSLGSRAKEAYGRADGYHKVFELAEAVRALDDTRPVTCAAAELVPTVRELTNAGIRPSRIGDDYAASAVSLGREKDLFKNLTEPFFAPLDLAGYVYLYPRYATDRLLMPGRAIVGLCSRSDKGYDAVEETDKNANVVGDFTELGVDCLGGLEPDDDLRKKLVRDGGDIDLTGRRKVISYYREIALGVKQRSYITVLDPETGKPDHLWNWPRHMGQPLTVEVYSSGDVVALYLDGKLVGRKLAGKINRHIATFKVNFYPGKLEAVSFHKGVEHSRATLESVTSPKAVKLSADSRTVRLGGDRLLYVDIAVTDKNGLCVPYAQREVEVTVTGEGSLVALGNADPYYARAGGTTVPVYNGRAVALIRAEGEGKIAVKAVSEGLASDKLVVKAR